MRRVSLTEFEAKSVKLVDRLALMATLAELERHLDFSPEPLVRDGLGEFQFAAFETKAVGHWAIMGSVAYPDVGASVWCEEGCGTSELVHEVWRAFPRVGFDWVLSQDD